MSNINCRTCFQTLQPNYKLSLKTEVSVGKTVEEILHFFIPEMVKSHFIDEFICTRCMDAIKIFMNFVKKFIDVENYLKGIIIKQQQIQENILQGKFDFTNALVNMIQLGSKNEDHSRECLTEIAQKNYIDKEKSNYENLQKRIKVRLNELLKDPAEDKERLKKVPDLPISGTIQYLDKDATPNNFPEIFIEINSNSSQKQEGHIFYNLDESQICELCGGNFVSDSCSNINCVNCISKGGKLLEVNETEDELEENTSTTVLENGTSITTLCPKLSDIPVSGNRNRTVSVTAYETEIADFVKKYSLYNINLFKLDSQEKTGPKRILFFGNTLLCCPECKEYFPSRQSIKAHIQDLHPSSIHTTENFKTQFFYQGSKECPVCKEKFHRHSMLENHVISQHKESYLYKCDGCGMKFKRCETYKQHFKIYELFHDCSIRKCSICGKMVHRDLYLKHRKTHQGIQCDICKVRCTTSAQVDVHRSKYPSHKIAEFNQTPKKAEKALCPVCGKLMLKSQLRVHLESHTETRSYLCDKCSKFFKSKYCLRRHIEIVHGDAQSYECSICNTKTKTRSGLRSHVSLKHFEVYSHVCHICGAGFTRRDYFRRHVYLHAFPAYRFRKYRYHSTKPTDPIPCKYCNKKFNRVVTLRMHLLSKHVKNPERPKCHYCDMTFSSVTNRLRHEKRHQNPDEFELTCSVCYNRFGSKEELDIHFNKHKDSQRRICEICGETFPSKHFLYHHKGEKHFDKEMVKNEKTMLLKEGLSHVLLDEV